MRPIQETTCPMFSACLPLLEVEVKSGQEFAGIYVDRAEAERGSGAVLVQPVVLVMPSKAGPAGHERVVAHADCVGGDIAEVGSRGASRAAARHACRSVR